MIVKTDRFGGMTPMVTAPLDHIQKIQENSDDNVLDMGENEGMQFFQVWKPDHARYVLQETEKNDIGQPSGAPSAVLAIRRGNLSDSFTHKHADTFISLASECCNDLLAEWQPSSENMSYQCFNLMFSATLRYVVGCEVDDSTKRGMWQAMPDMNRYDHNRLFTQSNIMDESYDRSFRFCRELFEKVTDERLRWKDRSDGALLSQVSRAYDLDDRGQRDQMYADIVSISLAASDAPSLALAWTLYAIARNPEVKRQVTREVDDILDGRQPTRQDLPQLLYTQAVVQETLRLHPPAWYTARTNVAEDVLGGVRIPAGSNVLVFQYLMHRDPEFWDNPEAFIPERFLGTRNHSAYMPYGWGSQYYFAADYCHFMLVAFLAMIVQDFDIRLQSQAPLEADPSIHLRMKHDLHLKIERRRQVGKRWTHAGAGAQCAAQA